MSMFVHNEPTSLAILQEAQVPDTFYNAVESGIEPAIEVITSVPNAIGALCLNQAGQNQFNEHKAVMSTFFSMFTSEAHIKILLEKDNANAIGGAIDELVRHHPSLKDVVFESIMGTLQKIEDLGNAFQIPKDQEHLYKLVSPASSQASTAPAQDPTPSSSTWLAAEGGSTVPSGVVTPAAPEPEEQEAAKGDRGDNAIASHIDILCRVSNLTICVICSRLIDVPSVPGWDVPACTSLPRVCSEYRRARPPCPTICASLSSLRLRRLVGSGLDGATTAFDDRGFCDANFELSHETRSTIARGDKSVLGTTFRSIPFGSIDGSSRFVIHRFQVLWMI